MSRYGKFLLLILFPLLAGINSRAQLVADFYTYDTSRCVNGLPVNITNTSTGSPTSYSWTLTNGTVTLTSAYQNPSFLLSSPGTYTVTLQIFNGSSTAQKIKTSYIVVHDTPHVDFSASTTAGCAPLNVNFTNLSTPSGSSATYTWYYGDGNNDATGVHTYTTVGTRSVTLTATNNWGCTNTRTKTNYISINPKPSGNMVASQRDFCKAPDTVTFTASASGVTPLTYAWWASDGWTATGTPATHIFSGPVGNSYAVRLITTDANGCKDTLNAPNYINLYNVKASFTSPSSVCFGSPITFTNTSTPAPGTEISTWDLGNQTNVHLPSPVDTYYVAGTYTIKLNYSVSGCVDTTSKQITVYPKNIIDFNWTPDTPCPAPIPITFHPTPATLAGYSWTFGDITSANNTSHLTTPSHLYQQNGIYTVSLVTTDSHGCQDSITKLDTLKIYDLEVGIGVDTAEGCAPLKIDFGATDSTHTVLPPATWAPYPYPIKSYSWDFGDPASGSNNTSALAQPSHVYNDTGHYTITLTITTKNNCTATQTFKIRVGAPPIASFTGPTRICYSDLAIFTNTTSTTLPINAWQWNFDVVNNSEGGDTARNGSHKFNNPGIDTVGLISLYNGCPSQIYKRGIKIDAPKAKFDVSYKCNKDSTHYVAFKNKSIGATSWVWDFGDGTPTTTVFSPLHLYTAPGNYTVRLTTYNDTTNCHDTVTTNVFIFNPIVKILANDTTVCRDDTVHFTMSTTNVLAQNYWWFVNNSFKYYGLIGDSLFDYQFTTTGTFNVLGYIADDHGCLDTAVQKVLVTRPTPNFTGSPVSGCTPFTVTFNDNSTATPGSAIVNRFWDFGNGVTTTTNTTITRQYNNPGNYDVRLVLTDDNGCRDSSWQFGYIQAHHPLPAFTIADTACLGDAMSVGNGSTFTDTSIWDFGDNTGLIYSSSPTHTYSATGVYTVRLLVRDQYGCKDSLIKTNAVAVIKPVADFTFGDSVSACIPHPVNFKSTSSAGNYVSYWWDFGDGSAPTTLTVDSASHVYLAPGIYKIYLAVENTWGCKDTVSKTLNILGYSGSGTYTSKAGCVPLTDTFKVLNLNNVPSIVWDFNDGSTATTSGGGEVVHTYVTPGAYLPKLLLVDSKGCTATSPGSDSIKVDVTNADFTWGPACKNGTVSFMDASKGMFSNMTAWLWTFDDNTTSTSNVPKHTYGPDGNYPVTLIATSANGCKDTVTKMVTINPLPNIDAGADTTICLHDSATLYPTGGVSYVWSPANYLNCTSCTNPLAAPPAKYKYIVQGTDANGCKNIDSVFINIKTKVSSIVGDGGEICDKDTLHLYVKGGKSYIWTPGESLDDNTLYDPIATPHKTTNYMVVAYEGRCIPDTNYVKVIVHPLPTVHAKGEQTIVAGNTADLQASGELIRKFAWSPADLVSCADCPFTTVKPSRTTTFTIKAYTDYGCVDSDKVTIHVLCDKSQLFIPNTFTPNGDGQNDVFYPRGTGLDNIKSIRIYNRWGEVVYQREAFALNDQSAGWDGTYKGVVLPPDVFVYIIEAYCDNGEIMTIKGDVTIVR